MAVLVLLDYTRVCFLPCQLTDKVAVMITPQEKVNVDVAMGLVMNLKVRNEQHRRIRKKEQQTEQKEGKKLPLKMSTFPLLMTPYYMRRTIWTA